MCENSLEKKQDYHG